jgi:hypothetical protein
MKALSEPTISACAQELSCLTPKNHAKAIVIALPSPSTAQRPVQNR